MSPEGVRRREMRCKFSRGVGGLITKKHLFLSNVTTLVNEAFFERENVCYLRNKPVSIHLLSALFHAGENFFQPSVVFAVITCLSELCVGSFFVTFTNEVLSAALVTFTKCA